MRRSPLARPLTAVLAAVLVSGVLVGCTGSPTGGGCRPAVSSGDASSLVSATGDVGLPPAVEFPTPLIAEEPQRSVVVRGEGEPAPANSVVRISFQQYVGATGAALAGSGASSGGTLLVASADNLAIGESLICATPGSRIVVTGPAEDLDPQYASIRETLVAVIDVEEVYLGKADGVNQLPQDGMPTVVTAVDGEPGIILTYQAAPDEPRSAVIKAGGGAVVREGDTLIVHGRSWNWPAGLGSSPTIGQLDTWAAGAPRTLDVTPDLGEDVVDALVGQRVGSQILVVLPNDDGSATVLVFDILGILTD